MVIVAGILGIELPVAADALAVVAEHRHRPVEQAAQLRQDRRAEIVFERLGIIGECAEQRAVDRVDPQRAQAVRRHVEARVEPALAADAAAERYRLSGCRRGRSTIDDRCRCARPALPDISRRTMRAAMGAAVDESVDRAVCVAVDDDRGVADIGRAEIAGVGDLGLEPEKIPDRPAKDPLLLALRRPRRRDKGGTAPGCSPTSARSRHSASRSSSHSEISPAHEPTDGGRPAARFLCTPSRPPRPSGCGRRGRERARRPVLIGLCRSHLDDLHHRLQVRP